MGKSGVHTTHMIYLQPDLITMALITGQTVSDGEFFPDLFSKKTNNKEP